MNGAYIQADIQYDIVLYVSIMLIRFVIILSLKRQFKIDEMNYVLNRSHCLEKCINHSINSVEDFARIPFHIFREYINKGESVTSIIQLILFTITVINVENNDHIIARD